MIGVNDATRAGRPRFERHVQSIEHQGRVLLAVDGPTHDFPAVGVHHRTAINFALGGGVFGDVGDPEFIGLDTVELTVDQVICGHHPA